jgi:hypothetical protein
MEKQIRRTTPTIAAAGPVSGQQHAQNPSRKTAEEAGWRRRYNIPDPLPRPSEVIGSTELRHHS